MQGQSEPKKEFAESEKGFEQERDKETQGTGSEKGRETGTAGSGAATGTAPQNPGTATQNPGTSGQEQSTTDAPIRNPSGDDLSEAIEGDEGSGRGI